MGNSILKKSKQNSYISIQQEYSVKRNPKEIDIDWIRIFKRSLNKIYNKNHNNSKYDIYWKPFKEGLEDHLTNRNLNSIGWLVDATYVKKINSIYKLHPRFANIESSIQTNKIMNNSDLNLCRENLMKLYDNIEDNKEICDNSLSKRLRDMKIYKDRLDYPIRKCLIDFLNNTIVNNPKHYIWDIIHIYKKIFYDKYSHLLIQSYSSNKGYSSQKSINLIQEHDAFSQRHKQSQKRVYNDNITNEASFSTNNSTRSKNIEKLMSIYEEIIYNILRIKDIMVNFIKYLYREYISMLNNCTKKIYDLQDTLLIENTVYEMIFESCESLEYKIIYQLLNNMHNHNINEFKNVCESLNDYTLYEFDRNIPNIFLLLEEKAPYQILIEELKNISLKSNPYKKYELMLIFQEEIIQSVLKYYHGTYSRKQIINRLSVETVVPLFLYAVLKSNNPGLIADIYFMKEFLTEPYLEKPQFQILENSVKEIFTRRIYNHLQPRINPNVIIMINQKVNLNLTKTTSIKSSEYYIAYY